MGASEFLTVGRGATAREAFLEARANALYQSGHGGYSGTIAEKSGFVEIALPIGKSAEAHAEDLMQENDRRIDDKWGPAGCIKLPEKDKWLFFGWASS